MAYDQELAGRVRAALAEQDGLSERKMFGGLAFMLHGNMSCGIIKDTLMVRVGPEQYAGALARPHVRDVDLGGRPMKGMVVVEPAALASDADLVDWVDSGVRFASVLPPKWDSSSRHTSIGVYHRRTRHATHVIGCVAAGSMNQGAPALARCDESAVRGLRWLPVDLAAVEVSEVAECERRGLGHLPSGHRLLTRKAEQRSRGRVHHGRLPVHAYWLIVMADQHLSTHQPIRRRSMVWTSNVSRASRPG